MGCGKTMDAPNLAQPLTVQDLEPEAEFGLEFVLPLCSHGRRGGHEHEVDAPPQQQFTEDLASLDCLSKTNVVSDQ